MLETCLVSLFVVGNYVQVRRVG